jgi:hypothetical protein
MSWFGEKYGRNEPKRCTNRKIISQKYSNLSFATNQAAKKIFCFTFGFPINLEVMTVSRSRLLFVVALLTIAVVVPMRWVDRQLRHPDVCCQMAGNQIDSPVLCFEFAWTPDRADRSLATWHDRLHILTFGFGLDFLFLFLYPAFLFLALKKLAENLTGQPAGRLASFFAPFALASGLFDAVENIGLLRYIFVTREAWLLKMSGVCAGIKFALLATALLIVLFGLGAWLLLRINNPSKRT